MRCESVHSNTVYIRSCVYVYWCSPRCLIRTLLTYRLARVRLDLSYTGFDSREIFVFYFENLGFFWFRNGGAREPGWFIAGGGGSGHGEEVRRDEADISRRADGGGFPTKHGIGKGRIFFIFLKVLIGS